MSLLTVGALSANAAEVEGIVYQDTVVVDSTSLVLNGVGIREKYFLDLYACGIYLPSKKDTASVIYNTNEIQSIRIVITSSLITKEKFNNALRDAYKKSTKSNYSTIKTRVDELKMHLGEEFEVGDVFTLCYVPEVGLKVSRNGELKGVVGGFDFKIETFKIWLGPLCVSEDLKSNLLGKAYD